jgi:ArsR family transcriptional regulator
MNPFPLDRGRFVADNEAMTKDPRRLQQAASCATKLRVLADPTRLAVLELLMKGPLHAGALARGLGVEQSLLSHHLQTLREAGLVVAERDGKSVLYKLAPAATAKGKKDGLDLGCCEVSFD